MRAISLQELKRRLGHFVERARAGETIVITMHRKPVAQLTSAVPPGDHVGENFGKGAPQRLCDNATNGAYLRVLLEDRYGGPER